MNKSPCIELNADFELIVFRRIIRLYPGGQTDA
jgi:hypothetical protein